MEIFSGLLQGFAVSLTWTNIMFCFIGVTIGTLIGVLPGIGPVATLSLIIPTTFSMSPVSAIILLAGVYYGASYGGSTTAILINVPGEVGAMMTCIDGYQMARKGRAGAALGISAIGSFVGGTLGTLGLVFRAVPLSKMALRIGPPEYFGLMCMALMLVIFLARGSMLKAISMALVGILLTSIGIHVATGQPRFTMDITELLDGVGLVPMIMGLYGISEVILNLEEGVEQEIFVKTKVKGLLPNQEEWRRSAMPILRGTFIGFLVGIFPGGGTVMSTIVSYAVEKKLHKHPEKFGTGMIEGVAGPETANNASTSGAFVPLFTLGIPSNVTMAIFLGAMMIYGVAPGPLLIKEHPEVFWGVVTSMYLGNVLLVILNLPLINLWVKVLKIPYGILFPLILLFCVIGAYSLNGKAFDIGVMTFFGLVGYIMRKLNYEVPPLVLAYVLGPIMEQALEQSLSISHGSYAIFFTRPISATAIGLALAMLASSFLPSLKLRREKIKE